MYVTAQALLNARMSHDSGLSIDRILRDLIPEDEKSAKKTQMREGERYYAGEHRILNHDFRESVVYGESAQPETVKNENNSNFRLVHNFHAHHVDQKVAYCFGKPMTVSVEGSASDDSLKAFEKELSWVATDEEFNDMVLDLAVGASNQGVAWAHPYYDAMGHLRFAIVPGTEVLAFYDEENQKELTDIVRYWTVTVERDNQKVDRHRVEWWTANDVAYLEENEAGHYRMVTSFDNDVTAGMPRCNPAPHWWSFTNRDGVQIRHEKHGWGRVPFVAFRNNRNSTTDLQMIQGLIDAYEMLSSKVTNDQIDVAYLYWLICGYGGEAAKSILKKLNLNKAAIVDDDGIGQGSIDAKTVTLATADRLAWLKFLRNDIYHQGRAFDESPETVGNATNVALELQYANLDMKADPFISKFKVGFKELFWFVTEDINLRNGTVYDSALVRVDIKKNRLINESELIDNILSSVGFVPRSILLAKHPYVEDVEQAKADLEAEKALEAKKYLNGDVE